MGGERPTAESPWAPLSHPVFRALWIASLASNIGTWMQNVGAALAMTSLEGLVNFIAPLYAASTQCGILVPQL
jgi:hypothetical protein